jgi:hypothetical protein
MPQNRMNREEFFVKLAPLDAEQRGKILWNLYWRGTAAARERIEGELDPPERERRKHDAATPPDPAHVLAEVSQFVELARSGAYIAGDRRVSRTERTKWRVTFRQLATDAQLALHAEDTAPGERAMELMGRAWRGCRGGRSLPGSRRKPARTCRRGPGKCVPDVRRSRSSSRGRIRAGRFPQADPAAALAAARSKCAGSYCPPAHARISSRSGPGGQLLEAGESAGTAAVLGRARALAAGALRVHRGRICRGAGLDGKLVFPAVGEVVLVTSQVPGLHQVTDPELFLVERPGLIAGVRAAVLPAGDPEHMQVRVLPSHRGLDDAMDPVQGAASGDHHLPPGRRAVTRRRA